MTTQASKIETPVQPQALTKSFEFPAWLPWFLTRIVSGLLVIFVISLIVFIATQALPSDPARVILGAEAPEATVQVLREQLGLNQPILLQYWNWLSQLLQGNFGRSIDSNVPVAQIIQNYFGNTVALSSLMIAITVPISVVLGVWLSLRRDSKLDRIIVSSSILFKAVPGFVIAIWLMMFFSTSILHVLPAASLLIPGQSPFSQLEFLILPILTLALSLIPYLMRLVRGSMIDALESDYVTSARLRGIPERRIIWKHVLPNALVPVVQGTALTIRVLLSGALIIEVVFSYPGIGNALNAAIEMRDIPTIQAIVLLLTICVVVVNLIADLITTLLTPKIRTAKKHKARSPGRRQALRLWKSGRPITVKPVDRRNALKNIHSGGEK
ncbi:MAG TPA: ABC transporter permease [Acinetobacter ursingii]|uniref:ABC transporter permease n=1 Tax=Acinetobacter ursingii TaxID=108980 RepID=A0A3D2SKY6_9GAMM|nr:ABC transporter permease [Acinetobacter ursingii]MCH2005823.1 ABC transporter permease [Acinetobacter ursingii]MCU4305407.1 ABC transporter permease [Acinetobacter ursingii]MCU4371413.1 ABC transporter permease [Acinetobacter ursingii]MCU4381075.1 ABC transporter permease [Acinetobacter ursingii]MCU4608833.1 ABC transporter permease [Acinetobacter ursingii]